MLRLILLSIHMVLSYYCACLIAMHLILRSNPAKSVWNYLRLPHLHH
jgi:hypothetical protein